MISSKVFAGLNSRQLLATAFVGLSAVACKQEAGQKAAGSGPTPPPVVTVGAGGDGSQPINPMTSFTVVNQRSCGGQMAFSNTIYSLFRAGAYAPLTVRNNFTDVEWILYASRSRTPSVSSILASITSPPSIHVRGRLDRQNGFASGFSNGDGGNGSNLVRFPQIENSTFQLTAPQSQVQSVVAEAQRQSGSSIVLVFFSGSQLITSNFVAAPPANSAGLMSMASSGLSMMVRMPTKSPAALCQGDANPVCEMECDITESPLVLDLNGDGFKTTSVDDGVKFDIDANGSIDSVAWMAAQGAESFDDAFLARDLDNNGRIDDGAELFGQATALADGSLPANGFIPLMELDMNADDRLDIADPAYANLLLWSDRNKNGVSEPEELEALKDHVLSIDLGFRAVSEQDEHGNQILARSKFKGVDGRIKQVVDFFFKVKQLD